MHFVGLGFEPAEIAFHAIPGARPFVIGVLPVIRIAVDDPVPPFFRELLERHIRWRFADFAELHQVLLTLDAVAAQPGFDHALSQSFGAVGQREVVIDADDPAESAAGGTGAERVIETEQRRGRLAVFNVAPSAMETVTEPDRRTDERLKR